MPMVCVDMHTEPMIRLSTLCLLLILGACERTGDGQGASDRVHKLAENGQTLPLLQAISASGKVDQRDVCYRTPLMLAAQFGHLETVQQLLAAGAQVNLHEKGYYTALMLAAGNGHSKVVERLAKAGASVNEVEFTRGWTALIWAAKRGHADTVALLLTLGADATVRDHQGRTSGDWALIQGHRGIAALL